MSGDELLRLIVVGMFAVAAADYLADMVLVPRTRRWWSYNPLGLRCATPILAGFLGWAVWGWVWLPPKLQSGPNADFRPCLYLWLAFGAALWIAFFVLKWKEIHARMKGDA